MPLVEAAHHGVAAIASDIPVFREIGGDHVRYFSALDVDDLARALRESLSDAVSPSTPTVLGWRDAATMVAGLIMDNAYQIDAQGLRERV